MKFDQRWILRAEAILLGLVALVVLVAWLLRGD